MIISYTTEDYFDWSLIFVKSFCYLHPDIKVHINSRNLKDQQIDKIKSVGSNIFVDNKKLSIKDLAEKYNIKEKDIENSRKGNNDKKKHDHRLWMNLTADGDRISQYYETVKQYPNEDYYLLCDIDLLFRKSLYDFFEEIKQYDVGLKLRVNKKSNILPDKINVSNPDSRDAKINIGTVFINNNFDGLKFLKDWSEINEQLPIIDQHKTKKAQYSIALTYNSLDMNYKKISPMIFDPELREQSNVWFFKSKKKDMMLDIAEKERRKICK